jgi:hypothetical protein
MVHPSGPVWRSNSGEGAAGWSARAANASMRAAQGNVVGRLMGEHASAEMADALQCLTLHGYNLGGIPIAQLSIGEDTKAALRSAARRLHWFVHQGDVLCRANIITKDLFEAAVVGTAAFPLWRDVVFPHRRRTAEMEGRPADESAWAERLIKEYPPSDRA